MRGALAPTLPRWQLVALAALLVFAHVYVVDSAPHFLNPNQISRVHLTLAIAVDHKLSIDPYLKMLGTEDCSTFGGHFYTDKSPGVSFWLAPFAWVLLGGGPHDTMTLPSYRELLYGLQILGMALPTVVAWLALLPVLREWVGSPSRAAFIVLAGALGTNALVYATHVFGVVPCAVSLFGAFLASRSAREPAHAATFAGPLRAALAGALAGLAFLFDPLAGFAVAVLGVHVVTGAPQRMRRAVGYAVGLAGPVALFLAYNRACFGHPLETGIHHLVDPGYAEKYARGFHGFNRPTADGLFGLWLSGRRGMLFLSPFLALALPGWWRMWRDGDAKARADAVTCVAVTMAVSLFGMMSIDWTGGWSVGSRYLVPAIPFVLVGVASALRPTENDRWLAFALGLAISSTVALAMSEVTFAWFPNVFRNPVASLAWPLLRSGCVTSAYWIDGAKRAALVSFVPHVVFATSLLVVFALKGTAHRARQAILALGFATFGGALFVLVPEPQGTLAERAQMTARVRGFLDCAPNSPESFRVR